MRWESRGVSTSDGQALPGLQRMAGLVRSVQTPQFEGITFHEVMCRSALNRVPAAARVPFRWTINPYRGCSHACTYCLAGDTPVLMSDGRQRPLARLRVGDRIIGTRAAGGRRRYVVTVVLDHWETRKPAVRLSLADGTTLTASGDHRFLTTRGWQHVTASGRALRRAHLVDGDQLMGFGAAGAPPEVGDDGLRAGAQTRVSVDTSPGLRVRSVQELGTLMPMYDITTGTGDFVADGVVSHNCFARGTHTYLDLDSGDDFDRQVVVKTNIAEVVRNEVAKSSWTREHVAMGTNTDPYQRAEGRYRLMPGIIDALAGSGTPFSVLTKGTLLRRDLPKLAAAAGSVEVGVGVSLAMLDDGLHRSVEPGTPTPRARLDMIRAIRDAGLPCNVLVAPVLPGLTDSVEQLDSLIGAVAEAGAGDVTVIPLHLRAGAREWYLRWLEAQYPDLVARYHRLYGTGAYAHRRYRTWLQQRTAPLLRRHGVDRPAERRHATGTPDAPDGTEAGARASPPVQQALFEPPA
ncbi:intein/intein [Haloactinopolyspora alba]|uniref:Intein/intein n=1 Tax=Haloactinopolyspora alba TaxID=648780 RepID=A0A2P8DI77_9ACTN|nr:Rv2578c family radical SAM protein [Haloactinopolyspora alba]PSK96926.1 intein/intein [Haloactinopolyspora alba]